MEDIEYLAKHGKEEAYIFIVDSARRDMYAYPAPSEYQIRFDAPFVNVFGFELLDATIPRTEYTVEENRNVFAYTVGDTTRTLTVEPGDYNLVQLCDAMNGGLTGVRIEPHSTPYQLRSRVRINSSGMFTFRASESSIAPILGFRGTESTYEATLTGIDEQRTFQGPFPGFDTQELIAGSTVVRQPFVPGVTGVPSRIIVHVAAGTVDLGVRLVDSQGDAVGSGTVSSETPEIVILDGAEIVAGDQYYVELVAATTANVYVSVRPDGVDPAESAETVAGPWTPLGSDWGVACEVYVTYNRYEIEGTGLVDLTGERHVLVRCEEIESNLYRERKAGDYHSGIGLVKLGGNGYQEERFNFVGFPARRLQAPIGKLDHLTFRLEKTDGTLYNARGVNHTLLCVIKYYVFAQESTRPATLNPGYTPDMIKFMNDKWQRESEDRDEMWVRDARW